MIISLSKMILGFLFLSFFLSAAPIPIHSTSNPLVHINLPDYSIVYEGQIINCSVQNDYQELYWRINNQSNHTTFYHTNPVLFDPEPTPLYDTYCNLTVTAVYPQETVSDTVLVELHRLFFGDIHFHSVFSDGFNTVDELYTNAILDNYVDFACLTDHAEIVNELDFTPPQPLWMFTRSLLQLIRHQTSFYDEWAIIKEKAKEYYTPGDFTTLLGFEYSPGPWYKGGFPWSEYGHEDISHVNFYYRDVYEDAPEYSARNGESWFEIFDMMNDEHNRGHRNIAFPHHPLATFGIWGAYTVNWTFLAQHVIDPSPKTVLMGAEVYSKWGQAIGKYSGIPITWPYSEINLLDSPQYWVETALWEWSEFDDHKPFLMIASSDNHATDRPASASLDSRISHTDPKPAGIIAASAVHNTRMDIWDSIAAGQAYGTQLLKIRAHVRFDDHCHLGQWINCTAPLTIQISAMSTFNGTDRSGKQMAPHAYSPDELDYPIEDIWIIKKDTNRGKPWCSVIAHEQPQAPLAVLTIDDPDVQPDDFYFVVIAQKGEKLKDDSVSSEDHDRYLAFLGPIFINEVY